MQYKQAKIFLFVAYLGLLTNLGPSLHYADFLGFHSHGGSNCCHSGDAHSHSGASRSHSGASHSHCGHSHAQAKPSDELTVRSAKNGHDCQFCKFFDQYHVTVEANESLELSEFSLIRAIERPSDFCSVVFVPVARGPPSAI